MRINSSQLSAHRLRSSALASTALLAVLALTGCGGQSLSAEDPATHDAGAVGGPGQERDRRRHGRPGTDGRPAGCPPIRRH